MTQVLTRSALLASAVEIARQAVARDETPLRAVREAALARLEETGLPGDRESFRFTETGRLDGLELTPAPAARDAALPADVVELLEEEQAWALVFANGRLRADLSRTAGLPAGVVLGELAGGDAGALAERLDATAGACAIPETKNGFAELNAAGFDGGAWLSVPARAALERPIYLVFLAAGPEDGAPALVQPRVLVEAGEASALRLVELHTAPTGRTLTNALVEVLAGPGSRVELTKAQRETPAGYHLATTRAVQGRDSRFVYRTVQRGGPLVRNDLVVVLEGEGAECDLKGAFVAGGADLVDDHVWVDHAKPHASSQQLYKGLVGGKGRGVFDGQILVREGAQKTSAHQQSRNLLLSEEALVHSNPRLRIFNDDVKCSHGSTLGQLDRDALFYLRSRGVPLGVARELLTYAFVGDVLEAVSGEPLREWLAGLVREGLRAAGGGDQ